MPTDPTVTLLLAIDPEDPLTQHPKIIQELRCTWWGTCVLCRGSCGLWGVDALKESRRNCVVTVFWGGCIKFCVVDVYVWCLTWLIIDRPNTKAMGVGCSWSLIRCVMLSYFLTVWTCWIHTIFQWSMCGGAALSELRVPFRDPRKNTSMSPSISQAWQLY